jgi:hypothetical protein
MLFSDSHKAEQWDAWRLTHCHSHHSHALHVAAQNRGAFHVLGVCGRRRRIRRGCPLPAIWYLIALVEAFFVRQ